MYFIINSKEYFMCDKLMTLEFVFVQETYENKYYEITIDLVG